MHAPNRVPHRIQRRLLVEFVGRKAVDPVVHEFVQFLERHRVYVTLSRLGQSR